MSEPSSTRRTAARLSFGGLGRAFASAGRATVRPIGRLPTAARACFLIAVVNAAIWAAVVPPFQVPDETAHFAYAQYVAETGKPPPGGSGSPYSLQQDEALSHLFVLSVIGHPQLRGVITSYEQSGLRAALARPASAVSSGGASSASDQPPLYYYLEAIPYWLSPSHELLARLASMRLLSALLAAGTVLVVFLFLRELFPRSPWTWTVGSLAVAFQPTFGFIAAGVQGDNLLFLTSALVFLLLLRAYRRGLTKRRALGLGAVIAAGVLSKLTFIALLPGIVLAIGLLAWRAAPGQRRGALRAVALAVAVAAVPVALYGLLNVVAWHRGSPTASGLAGATNSTLPHGSSVTLADTLSYIWQLYLPRLWFMHRYFSGYPLWSIWLDGSIGHFGWLDYSFPAWVYTVGRYLLLALLGLAFVGLARAWDGVKPLLPILACFAVMALGLLGAIGYAGIRFRLANHGNTFEQARYVLPLLPLYAAFVVTAARGGGPRWAPPLGAAIVLLAMAHGLFAETLTISRYYG